MVREKLGTNPDPAGVSDRESTTPFQALIQVLNGAITLGAFKEVVKTSVGKLAARTVREKEVGGMIKEVLGKGGAGEPTSTLSRATKQVAETFYVSGSAADKKELLAALKNEGATQKNEAAEAERRADLYEQLEHCPVWSKLQDGVQLHVRRTCPEYQAYRHADADANVEDASFVAKKMEDVSMTFQTATATTLTTVATSREEKTTTQRGKKVITKIASHDDREVSDAWQYGGKHARKF